MVDSRELRTVTVLFSDLSGFTRMSEGMDPEDVQDMIDALFRRFRSVIESAGGTVDKFIGDAVMAVFGAPVAHEDDAARAVRAGLALQRDLTAFNAERGCELRLRIGIHSGEVLWGTIGGDRATAMGDAVNVAQRLEGACRPGAVLASADVERQARRAARFRQLGAIRVKGREAPVEVFEAEEGTAEWTAATEGRMHGRAAESAQLVEFFESGLPIPLVVEGEAGTGKSRLLGELRAEIRRRRPAEWIAAGRAMDGAAVPLAPLGEIVRSEAGAGGPAQLAEALAGMFDGGTPVERENLAQLLVLSLGLAVPGSRVHLIEPARLPAEILWAWERWLASRGPGLLLIEDAHALDAATAALLGHIAQAVPRLRFVLASRPGADLPAAWPRLSLADLPAADARTLVEDRLGTPASPALFAFLQETCGGNPAYLEELLRFLRERSLVAGSPADLTSAPDRLPDGLRGLLLARLDALPDDCRSVLKGASVVGRTFWEGFLRTMLEREVSAALEVGRDLVRRDGASLLREDGQFLFRHGLLRDAAYSLLPRRERARLHVEAARLLESRTGDADRWVTVLAARHREAAGETGAAAALLLDAARRASAACANEEALTRAREASALGGGPVARLVAARALAELSRFEECDAEAGRILEDAAATPDERAEAMLLRARGAAGRGRHLEALSGAEAATEAALDPSTAAEAWILAAAMRRRLGRQRESEVASGRALELAARGADGRSRALHARALLESGSLREAMGAWDDARKAMRDALALFLALGDRAGAAACHVGLASVHRQSGEYDDALASASEALAFREEVGDRAGIATILIHIGAVHRRRGDFEKAEAAFERSVVLFGQIGNPAGASAGLTNLGLVLQNRGESARALAAFSQAEPALRDSRDVSALSSNLVSQGQALRDLARPAEARAALDEALRLRRDHGDIAGEPYVLDALGILASDADDFPEALRLFEASLSRRRELGDRVGIPSSLSQVGHVRSRMGDHAAARVLLEEALSLARTNGDRTAEAEALNSLSMTLRDLRELPAAADCARAMLALREQLQDRAAAASARNRLGELLILLGRPDEAIEVLRKALDEARAIGNPQIEKTALERLELAERARAKEVR